MKAATIALYLFMICINTRSSSSLKHQQHGFDAIKDTDADAGKHQSSSNLFLRRNTNANIRETTSSAAASASRFLEPMSMMSMMSLDIHDFSFSMATFSMTTTTTDIIISDGTPCGDGTVGNGICRNEGDCCSQYGRCGRTAEYCDEEFSSSSNSDENCGDGNVGNGICRTAGYCCSQYGWCGITADYCDDGGGSIASSTTTTSPSLKLTTGEPTTAPTTDEPTTMKVSYELVSIISSSTTSPSLKPTSKSPTTYEEPTIEPTYIKFPVTDHPIATTLSSTPSLINCKWTEAYENTDGRGKCMTEEKFFVPYNCFGGNKSYKICCTPSFIRSPFESEEYGTCYKVYQWSIIEGIIVQD